MLRQVNLRVEQGDTLSIQGVSGSGKTTLLKIIAGLQHVSGGSIYLGGKEISGEDPRQRNVVYLYQEALLFPHLTLHENIAFGLRIREVGKDRLHREVQALIRRLGLEGMEERTPDQLSGGQKQRVAFGRGLIVNPDLLLLDEPFASLDRETRKQMQQLFKEVVHERNMTSLFVTHNVKEAIIMGDRIARLENGQLKRYDSMKEFIDDPASGVKEEKKFWQSLENGEKEDTAGSLTDFSDRNEGKSDKNVSPTN